MKTNQSATVSQLADVMNVKRITVYRLVKSGEFGEPRRMTPGGRYRVDMDQIVAYQAKFPTAFKDGWRDKLVKDVWEG